MALVKCPECEKEISDRAKVCPNCGCPISLNQDTNVLICSLQGVGGQVYLYSNRVIITRKGAIAKLTQFFKGDKEIFLNQISAIQLRKGGLMVNGYIQFTLSGGNENTGGIVDATQDENTVMFQRKYNSDAQFLKQKICELKNI